ncbi:MAG: hypothetical protein CML66_19885 [Rhodobacteraceae bacterium]|nr:hypothetical protein [Paracoccaceae bacterium]MAY47848.1 hypothetical protein [Paracoccaceae bacterium]QEW18768.1 hypothetical protein LA6_000943 [Marinibacterium anthonyi]
MTGPRPNEPETARSTPLGLYDKPRPPQVTGIEITAVVLSVLWLGGALAFFLLGSSGAEEGDVDSLRFLMTMLAIFLPVGMIWVAATAARASRVMREESQRLQTAIDAIRTAYMAQTQRGAMVSDTSVQKKLDEIAETTRRAETALAVFTTMHDRETAPRPVIPAAPEIAAGDDGQTSLELGTPAEALQPPPPVSDFIRALNFPETAEDTEGFAALRRALKDRKSAQLIQASQDVLTLLSQEGIYMDDLRPDMARPDVWRQFAHGVRGRAVAPLGGVRDRSSLALAAARMKQDPIFRDAAHHFLRRFDHMFSEFEAEASDAEISALGDTRTARAFMLLGRVAGTFD